MSNQIEVWKVTTEQARHHDNLYWQEVRHFVGIVVLLGGGAGAALTATALPPPLRLALSGALLLLGATLALVGKRIVRAEGAYIGYATRSMMLAETAMLRDATLYPEDIRDAWIRNRKLGAVDIGPEPARGRVRVGTERLLAAIALVFLLVGVSAVILAFTRPETVSGQIVTENAGQQGDAPVGASRRR